MHGDDEVKIKMAPQSTTDSSIKTKTTEKLMNSLKKVLLRRKESCSEDPLFPEKSLKSFSREYTYEVETATSTFNSGGASCNDAKYRVLPASMDCGGAPVMTTADSDMLVTNSDDSSANWRPQTATSAGAKMKWAFRAYSTVSYVFMLILLLTSVTTQTHALQIDGKCNTILRLYRAATKSNQQF